MHPWHDIPVDEEGVESSFPALVEIPRGSKNKYEVDKPTGALRLDRVLHSAVHYPANYGFVPRTLAEDGDPLDVLALCQEPVHPLTLLDVRAIGLRRMADEKGVDDKIIAVTLVDPAFSDYRHHSELPRHTLLEMERFFRDYKLLEKKAVEVEGFLEPSEAIRVLRSSIERYRAQRPGAKRR